MAQGLFTLRQQVQGIVQKAWNTPVGTYAGSFNGSSQYLSLPSIAAYTLSADFTIEFWVNATSYPSTGGGSPTVLSGTNTLNNWLVLVDSGTIAFYWNQTEIVSGGTTNIVGSWFHVAVVRSGSTVTIYKNGTRLNSATNASSFTLTSPLFIGQQNTGVGYWAGLISNVRIVKGTAVYTQNFAPPTTPLAAITNTSLLTLQNATIIDNSTNAATITNNGSVTTGAAMPFTQLKTPAVDYLVVAGGGGGGYIGGGGGAGGLLQGSVPVAAGSAITVTVGSGGAGGTGGAAGASGTASVFSAISSTGGGGGGANSSASPGLSGGSGGGAYASSGYLVGGVSGQGIVGQGNAGGLSYGGTNYTGGGGGGAGTVGLNGNVNAAGNGGAGIASAINGTVTTYSGGGAGPADTNGTGGSGGVGGGGAGGISRGATGGSGTVNGVTGSTNTGGGGGGYGVSGTGGTGGSGIVIVSYPDVYAGAASTTGSPTVSTSGSGSFALNGSSNFKYAAQTPFAFGTGDFTIETWVYLSVINSFYTLFDFRYASNGAFPYIYKGTDNRFGYYVNSSERITGTTALATGSWYHVVVCRSGTSTKMYINGVQEGSTYTDTTNYSVGNPGPTIFSEQNGNYSWNGYASNVRFVKGVCVYTGNFTPPTTPLTATQSAGTNIAAITGTSTSLLLNTVSGAYLADGSVNSYSPGTITGTPTWNQASPFATGLGYKNRVYTYTGSGSITF